MQRKNRIVDAKFLQFTNEGHILVLVPRGGDLLINFIQNHQQHQARTSKVDNTF